MPSKVGDVVALKGSLKGQGEPSDLVFRVIDPNGQARTYPYGESPKVVQLPTTPGQAQEYKLMFPVEIPGHHTYEMRAMLDGVETKALGEFHAEGTQIKIAREVSLSEAVPSGGSVTVIHEMISLSVPAVDAPDVPEVPLFPDIDLDAIKQRDPNPAFVTRPIGVLDEQSINDLLYDDYLMAEIERQVREKRPPARRGHVPEDAKGWMVPPSVGFWVGVLRVGRILWGKCYILPSTPFHDEVQASDAVGGRESNSIYGDVTLSMGYDGQMKCVGLALESIDFVPPERAALQALGGEFEVTREMSNGGSMADKKDTGAMSDEQKKEVAEAYLRECSPAVVKEMLSEAQKRTVASDCVKEMQPTDVSEMLSEAQQTHCAEAVISKMTPENIAGKFQESSRMALAESLAKGMGMKLTREDGDNVSETKVAEMRASIAEMATLKTQVAELQRVNAAHQLAGFNRALDTAIDAKFDHIAVRTDDGKRKIASLKLNLRPQVVAEMAASTKVEDIEPAVTRAYESMAFKPLAEMTIQSLAGPSAFVGVTSVPGSQNANHYGWDPQTGRYSDDKVDQAKSITNTGRRG